MEIGIHGKRILGKLLPWEIGRKYEVNFIGGLKWKGLNGNISTRVYKRTYAHLYGSKRKVSNCSCDILFIVLIP